MASELHETSTPQTLAGPDPSSNDPSADTEIIWPPPPPGDPWAHRRGEPRIFLLLWIGWLMLITAIAFGSIGPRGIVDPDEARPATRLLLLMLTLGPALLWPAFRLAQVRPRRVVGAILLDVVVLVVPAQIVIWPQVLLAYWPVPVIAAVGYFLTIWTVLVASILIFAFASEASRAPSDLTARPLSRATWLLVIFLLALFAPALSLMLPAPADPLSSLPDAAGPVPLLALSPFTAGHELTADRFWTGSSSAILPQHWAALGWLFAGACVLLGGAVAYALLTARRVGDHSSAEFVNARSPAEMDHL